MQWLSPSHPIGHNPYTLERNKSWSCMAQICVLVLSHCHLHPVHRCFLFFCLCLPFVACLFSSFLFCCAMFSHLIYLSFHQHYTKLDPFLMFFSLSVSLFVCFCLFGSVFVYVSVSLSLSISLSLCLSLSVSLHHTGAVSLNWISEKDSNLETDFLPYEPGPQWPLCHTSAIKRKYTCTPTPPFSSSPQNSRCNKWRNPWYCGCDVYLSTTSWNKVTGEILWAALKMDRGIVED